MIGTAIRAIRLMSAGAPMGTVILFALIAATALLEMLSIGLVIPLVQVAMSDGATADSGGRALEVIRRFLPNGSAAEVGIGVAATFAAVFVLKNLVILALTYLINWTVLSRAADAQGRLFNAYLGKPLAFHIRTNSAELLRNVMSGCGQSFEAARQVFMMGLEFILSVAALLLLLIVEPMMMLIVSAFLIPGSIAFYVIAGPRFRVWGQRSMDIEGEEIRWINQALGSIRFAKIFGAVGSLTRNLYLLARARAVFDSRAATSLHIPRLFLETLVVVGLLATIGIAISAGRPTAELPATLGVFAMAALRLLPSVNRLLAGTGELRRRSPYIDTVYDDLVTNRELLPSVAGDDGPATAESRFAFARDLRLEDVVMRYDGADVPALDHVSLTVKRGESVGIVGPSGAGKSSLVDTVIGLLHPESGSILVDGANIADRIDDWQRLIGYVPQDIYLLDDTLQRNVAFAIGDTPVSEERVRAALRLARLDDVVAALPDGLDTMLGERGARLSGGQRQRIAIARALYRNPEVLVFDEATAALDNESESEISAAIRALAGDKTIFLIAHRLSTVRDCDRIVFMRNGRIDDTGRFEELYARSAAFRGLVDVGDLRLGEPEKSVAEGGA